MKERETEDTLGDLLKSIQYAHLYKTHPHYDKYPEYMKSALMANEILQGRVAPKK